MPPDPIVLEDPLDEDFVQPLTGVDVAFATLGADAPEDAEPFVAPEEPPKDDEVPEE